MLIVVRSLVVESRDDVYNRRRPPFGHDDRNQPSECFFPKSENNRGRDGCRHALGVGPRIREESR